MLNASIEPARARPVVHIIDEDSPLGGGLRNLLSSLGFDVTVFESPNAFIANWNAHDCGCLLMDLHFPDGDGLDYQARFLELGISMPVVLMAERADVYASVRGMKAGAVDFLVKPFNETDLVSALRIGLDRDASRIRREARLIGLSARYATLTAREKEVMRLVVSGLMNKQVAGLLSLSEITVKVHRGTMMRKMELRTLADLVRAAEALGAT